jgi:membrane protein implicated in regulation of membrane protease activity
MDYGFWMWLGAAVLLSVAEIFTAGFFLLPFGIGAAAAAAVNYFNYSVAWQWTTFIAISALSLFALRRFSDHMTHEPPQKVAGDRLIGKEGAVIARIDNQANTGRVRVEREEWVADSADGSIMEPGTRVRVNRVVGVHLVVESCDSADCTDQ